MSNDKIFIHKDKWLYGPVSQEKPDCFRADESDEDCPECWAYYKNIVALPKYRWTGPALPDWKEVVLDKDFELTQCDCDKYMSGKRKCDRTDGPFRAPLCSIAIPLQQSQPAESGEGERVYAHGLSRKYGRTPEYQYNGPKCVPGCKHYAHYETKHHKDCPFYPNSLSEYYDKIAAQSPSTSGEKLYREVRATDGLPDDKHDKHLIVHGANWTGWYDREKELWLTDSNESFESDQVVWLKPYTPTPLPATEVHYFASEYIGEKIKKEMRGKYIFDHPARKIFDSVCWRLYGQTFDTLCSDKANWGSGFWLDIILPAMQQYAESLSTPLPDAGREAIEFAEWLYANKFRYDEDYQNWWSHRPEGTPANLSTQQLYALFSSRHVQPFICLNCKRVYESEPDQCECGGKTFQKTHPSNRPVQVSPSINEQHLIAAARYGFKYATESQTHHDESVPDGNVLQWWQWYQTQPEFKGVQVSEEQDQDELWNVVGLKIWNHKGLGESLKEYLKQHYTIKKN
jgi:hypothetical protein